MWPAWLRWSEFWKMYEHALTLRTWILGDPSSLNIWVIMRPVYLGLRSCKGDAISVQNLFYRSRALDFPWVEGRETAGRIFPDQGSNLCSLHWKCGVLTTGTPGKFPGFSLFWPRKFLPEASIPRAQFTYKLVILLKLIKLLFQKWAISLR